MTKDEIKKEMIRMEIEMDVMYNELLSKGMSCEEIETFIYK